MLTLCIDTAYRLLIACVAASFLPASVGWEGRVWQGQSRSTQKDEARVRVEMGQQGQVCSVSLGELVR